MRNLDDDDETVRDGGRVRVPMVMMDNNRMTAIDYGDDVVVRETGHHPGLAAEAVDDVLLDDQTIVEDLQCDRALEDAVVGAEDARHASGADELFELVPVRDHVAGHQFLWTS